MEEKGILMLILTVSSGEKDLLWLYDMDHDSIEIKKSIRFSSFLFYNIFNTNRKSFYIWLTTMVKKKKKTSIWGRFHARLRLKTRIIKPNQIHITAQR